MRGTVRGREGCMEAIRERREGSEEGIEERERERVSRMRGQE